MNTIYIVEKMLTTNCHGKHFGEPTAENAWILRGDSYR